MDGNTHSFLQTTWTRVCGTRRWCMPEALVASLGVATPATAEFACKPALTFKDVRRSSLARTHGGKRLSVRTNL